MKIAALTPQFVIEGPEAVEETTTKAQAEAANLKVVGPDKSSVSDNSGGHLERETRDGLKRLSRLIQGKKANIRRLIARYIAVDQNQNALTDLGRNLDRSI